MTTPLVILCLLTAPIVVQWIGLRITGRRIGSFESAGRLGLSLVFCFTAIGHFVQPGPMAEMLPGFVPGRIVLVYSTGVVELAAAIALLVPRLRRITGWALIVMLVLFLPVNVYAAANRIGIGGHQWGPVYLLIRVPLQATLIGWTWWFAAKTCAKKPKEGNE